MALWVGEGLWFANRWPWTLVICLSSLSLSVRLGDGATFLNVGYEYGEDEIGLSGKPGLSPSKPLAKVGGVEYHEFTQEIVVMGSIEEYKQLRWEISLDMLANGCGGRRECCTEAFNDKIWTLEAEEDIGGSIDLFSLLIVLESGIQQCAFLEADMEMDPIFSSMPEGSSYLQQSKMESDGSTPVKSGKRKNEERQMLVEKPRKKRNVRKRYGKTPYGPVFIANSRGWKRARESVATHTSWQAVLKWLSTRFVVLVNEKPKVAFLFVSWGWNAKAWLDDRREINSKLEMTIASKLEKTVDEKMQVWIKKKKGGVSFLNAQIKLLKKSLTSRLVVLNSNRFNSERVNEEINDKPGGWKAAEDEGGWGGNFPTDTTGISDNVDLWIKSYLIWAVWQDWLLQADGIGWVFHEWLFTSKAAEEWLTSLATDEGSSRWMWYRAYCDLHDKEEDPVTEPPLENGARDQTTEMIPSISVGN